MIPRPKPERFRLRRTMMFMNAQKPGLIKDAYIYGCDSIMLDLEDAVAENQKDAARFSLYHALKTIDYGDTEVIVRINGLDTPHWQEDIRVCVAGGADGIRIAKCESANDVHTVEAAVEKIEDAEQKAAAQATLDARKYEIDTMYIGAQQYESSTFSVVVPDTASIAKADKDEYVMSFVGEFGEMDMEAFAPQSREELYHDGETRAAQIAESVAISQTLASPAAAQTTKTNPSDPTDYDRVAARD